MFREGEYQASISEAVAEMAARIGPRAQGTDGSDFTHRERVASHYQQGAEMKAKLRRVLKTQMMVALMCLAVCLVVHFDGPSIVCILGYAIGIPLCHFALNRNDVMLINLYGTSLSLLGVFPMAYTIYLFFWTGGLKSYRFVRLFEAFMVIAVNGGAMYLAKNLMYTWLPRTNPVKKRR